jgi:hypothetical protein
MAAARAVSPARTLVAEDEALETHTPKARVGRPKKGSAPKMDFDDDIKQANLLADAFKKMYKASKAQARNVIRSKQRVSKKAKGLSVQDIMRIAVLKRCGLVPPADEPAAEGASAAASSGGGGSGSSAGSSSPQLAQHMAIALNKIQGGADILKTTQQWHEQLMSAPVENQPGTLAKKTTVRGKRLGPAVAEQRTSLPIKRGRSQSNLAVEEREPDEE